MHTQIIDDIAEGRADLRAMPSAIQDKLLEQLIEHAKHDRLDRALEFALALLTAAPDDPKAWVRVAGIYQKLGQIGLSARCIEQALRRDEQDRAARLLRGELLIALGQPKEGLLQIEEVFQQGHKEGLPPEEQDDLTLHAGALLEGAVRFVNEYERMKEAGELPEESRP